MNIAKQLASELNIAVWQSEAALKLLEEGNTVPFIARYRKEATGSLDDQKLREFNDRLTKIKNLETRREEIINAIVKLEAMTDELNNKILNARTISELEDLYMPYKKKKRTRATVAKEKGLEPLANIILTQRENTSLEGIANEFINLDLGVETVDDAINGALDIIAEIISENSDVRGRLRDFLFKTATIKSTSKSKERTPYEQYYDYNESVKTIASHRVLAINRGEKEKILKISLISDLDREIDIVKDIVLENKSLAFEEKIVIAIIDSLKRLILPSLENEIRSTLTEKAEESAIHVFGLNLKPLLMQPPLKDNVIMGFDPAYRTGCKIAVVNQYGKVLATTVVYPTPPQNKTEEASEKLLSLIKKYNITAIAIGNGTASKESEIFISELIKGTGVKYMVVSEAGASVYSASKLAAEEFPEFDVSLRSAVSIARRLLDPLAELVKIEPKAIGVGQYQHDMPQTQLEETLSGVVEDCVNSVGVDLNTASHSLLSYVAGLGPKLAKNIVEYREENGAFASRKELLKVNKLGAKAYTQAAGFLRIENGDDPLDNTAVHPESYDAAKNLLKICGIDTKNKFEISNISEQLKNIDVNKTSKELNIGKETLADIILELLKPGRDPRDELPKPMLRSDLLELKDLKPDMILKGTVRNVVDFGAFIDIGVHQDGLVHISRICDKFIRHPSEALAVGDIVDVKILEVDVDIKRISLTMKDL